jgi:PBSX family phage terminase large subunit
MGLWCVTGNNAVRIDEYYYSGRTEGEQKTDDEYYSALVELAGDKPIEWVVIDPSAASMIALIKKHGKFRVAKAKNEVLDGIRFTANLLKNGRMKIHRKCEACINEFGLYKWDEKATEDKVVKDNDHAMDDTRYFANTIMRKLYRD